MSMVNVPLKDRTAAPRSAIDSMVAALDPRIRRA